MVQIIQALEAMDSFGNSSNPLLDASTSSEKPGEAERHYD